MLGCDRREEIPNSPLSDGGWIPTACAEGESLEERSPPTEGLGCQHPSCRGTPGCHFAKERSNICCAPAEVSPERPRMRIRTECGRFKRKGKLPRKLYLAPPLLAGGSVQLQLGQRCPKAELGQRCPNGLFCGLEQQSWI